MKPFATVVRERRRQMGLSGFRLAIRADVTPASISLYEAGKTTPRPATLRRLANALELDPAQLAASTVAGSA